MPDSEQTRTATETVTAADDVAFAPTHVLAERLRSGESSASALVDLYLRRIRRHDATLHAFVDVYEDAARAAAEAADRLLRAGTRVGPLHGIPVALKDLLEIAGRVTTGGSQFWRDRV